MTVRVLAVHPRDLAEPTGGGIQTFLRDFVAYSPQDFEIYVCGTTADPVARPVGEWSSVKVGSREARLMPVARSGSLLRDPLAVPRALRALYRLRRPLRQPGTILQLHRPYRNLLLDGHRGPRIQIIHLDLEAWPGRSGWRRLNWLYRDFAAGLERFDAVFVANETGAEKLRASNPAIAHRIHFLSGWYDDRLFRPLRPEDRVGERARLVSQMGMPAESVSDRWILFVGRLDPIKDPALAVDALAALAQTATEPVRFIVAGDGEERDSLLTRATERGIADRLHTVGDLPREAVAALMAAGDVLLVTSIAEGGGPRVVLEALGSGLPVVSTVVGEVRRAVRSGVNGCLSEERSAGGLAAGLRWTLDQPRDEMAAAATAAARPFVAAEVLRPLYATYRELASRQAGE